jgi:hypothetical protein
MKYMNICSMMGQIYRQNIVNLEKQKLHDELIISKKIPFNIRLVSNIILGLGG